MEYIKDVVYQFRGRPELVRLRVGPLLEEIMQHFAQKISATLNPDRSLWLYSTHSSTFIPILNGLGFFEVFNQNSFRFTLLYARRLDIFFYFTDGTSTVCEQFTFRIVYYQ